MLHVRFIEMALDRTVPDTINLIPFRVSGALRNGIVYYKN